MSLHSIIPIQAKESAVILGGLSLTGTYPFLMSHILGWTRLVSICIQLLAYCLQHSNTGGFN